MDFLDRDAFFDKAAHLPIERVDLPELDGYVYTRVMAGDERDLFDIAVERARKEADGYVPNIHAMLVALTCCNQYGQLLFSTQEAEQLGRRNGVVLNRIFT